MSKFSEFPKATTLSMDDLMLISRLVSEGKYASEAAPLSLIANLLGGVRVVDVGVDLSSLDEQGIYILQGAETFQASYNLGYPFGLQPGSKVMMIISAEGGDYMGTITQHYFHSKTSTPFPQSRYKSATVGATYSAWDQPMSGNVFDQKGVQQLNMSTYGFELQSTISNSASALFPFPAVGPASAPNPKTSPTLKQGIHFSVKNQKAGFYEGAYRGNVIIVDEDNRMFMNVDKTFVSDAENPKGVNWKEMVGMYLNDKETLSTLNAQPSFVAMSYTLNKIIGILRDMNVLLPGNTVAKTATYEDDGQDIVAGADPTWIGFLVLPADSTGKLFVKSADETVVVLFDSDTGEQVTGGTLTESIDMVNRGNTPETAVQYGACTIKVKGLKEGKVNLIAATDSGFANVVGTMEITVKASS